MTSRGRVVLPKRYPCTSNDCGMIEEGKRIEVADSIPLVEQSGHPEAIRAFRLEDVRPLGGFERHSIRAVKARRDETDTFGKMSQG